MQCYNTFNHLLVIKFTNLLKTQWELQTGATFSTIGLVQTNKFRFLSRVSILLLTRDIDIVILSVRPSVCLSVTRWYCMKTA